MSWRVQSRMIAVVASDVRSQEQRSAAAPHAIKTLIASSADRVEAGSRQDLATSAAMQDIVTQVQRATHSSAAVEQSTALGQASEAVSQMDQDAAQRSLGRAGGRGDKESERTGTATGRVGVGNPAAGNLILTALRRAYRSSTGMETYDQDRINVG